MAYSDTYGFNPNAGLGSVLVETRIPVGHDDAVGQNDTSEGEVVRRIQLIFKDSKAQKWMLQDGVWVQVPAPNRSTSE